jgi:hypothetical protein
MPVLLGLLAAAAGVIFWMYRARNVAHAAKDLGDMAGDVMSAARRFGFRRRYNEHPVDSLQDPDVAVAGAGVAFLELAGLPSSQQQAALLVSLQHHLNLSHERGQEAMILGRWLMSECGGAQSGFSRMTRRLAKLSGLGRLEQLMAVLQDVSVAGGGGLAPLQKDALAEVAQAYKLR